MLLSIEQRHRRAVERPVGGLAGVTVEARLFVVLETGPASVAVVRDVELFLMAADWPQYVNDGEAGTSSASSRA